ncbi:MAG: hypothetical protein M3289_05505, partial [Actinomycetota bacterium]|nr:hypothetical protein [Actinomycetota bacterium]
VIRLWRGKCTIKQTVLFQCNTLWGKESVKRHRVDGQKAANRQVLPMLYGGVGCLSVGAGRQRRRL